MAVEQLSTDRPRDFPRTLLHMFGALAVLMFGNLLWVPIGTIPAWLILLLSGNVPSDILLTALFGVVFSISMGSTSKVLDRIYSADTESDGDESNTYDPESETFDENMRELMLTTGILIGIMIAYLSLLYLVAVTAATFVPAYATAIALLVPALDKFVLNEVGHSPVSVVIEAMAWLIEALHVVEDVDTSVLRSGGAAALI